MSLSIVQHAEALSFPATGNPTLTPASPVTKGNLLILQVQTTTNAPLVPDDGRNLWVAIPPSAPASGGQGFIQAFWAIAESTRALTINFFGISSGGTGNFYQSTPVAIANSGAQFIEWTGNSTTGGIYGGGQGTGTTATPFANGTITAIGDVAMAFCIPSSGDTVVEAMTSLNVAGAGTNRSAVYKVAVATGGIQNNFTQSASAAWAVISFNITGPKATHTISGALGAAGAGGAVTFISQTSGYTTSATADASGNYTATLETDTWIVQPQKVGASFSPNAQTGVSNSSNVVENFTSITLPTALTFVQAFADSMVRANESPLSDGGSWTINGTPVPPFDTPFDLVSDEAVAHNVTPAKNYAGPWSGDAVSVWDGTALPCSQYVNFQIDGLNTSALSHATFALSFRSSSSNVTGYFYAGVNNGDGTLTLGLWALGAPVLPVQPTNLTPSALFNHRYAFWKATVPFTVGDNFAAAAVANVVYLYHNGVLIGTMQDQATQKLMAGTLVLYAGANATTDVKISNVKAGTAYVTGAPVTDVVNGGGSGSVSTASASAFPLLAGEGMVVFLRWNRNTSQNVSSVTDTATNTFVQVGTPVTEGSTAIACYYCANAKPNAANAVKATFSAAVTFVDITVMHVPALGALDTSASAVVNPAGTTIVGTISTANANELVFCYCQADAAGASQASITPPLTMNVNGGTPNGSGFSNSAWQAFATPQTSKTFTATPASSLTCSMLLVAFGYTPAASGGGPASGSTIYPTAGGTNPQGANIYPNVSPLIYP